MIARILNMKVDKSEEFLKRQGQLFVIGAMAYFIALNVGALLHQFTVDVWGASGLPAYQTFGGGLIGYLFSSPIDSYQTSYYARIFALLVISPVLYVSIQLNAQMSEIKLPETVKPSMIKQRAYLAYGILFIKQLLNYAPVTSWLLLILAAYLVSVLVLGFGKSFRQLN